MQRVVYKILFIAAALLFSAGASAQTEVNFRMEIDTIPHGIYAGQEFELAYTYTGTADSVSLPRFTTPLEIVKGPMTSRGSSKSVINGKEENTEEISLIFHVRFLREGVVNLPESKLIKDGRVYTTPSLSVCVHPARTDIENVKCEISTQKDRQRGEYRVTITCNRRPDTLTPLLQVGGQTYRPSGRGSSLSLTSEQYDFYYHLPIGTNTCFSPNLTFGGIPYPDSTWTINPTGDAIKSLASDIGGYGWIIILVITGALIWGIVWLRFRNEANEELAQFVIRHKHLSLKTDWAMTHYGATLVLLFIPVFVLFLSLYDNYDWANRGFSLPVFWVGIFPLVLAYITYRSQRSKLNFQPVETPLSLKALQDILEETALANDWTIDHLGDDCFVAHTHRSPWSATWGEQVFVVFDKGQVWVNSVNDLDKRTALFSFGYPQKNMRIVQEAIQRNI